MIICELYYNQRLFIIKIQKMNFLEKIQIFLIKLNIIKNKNKLI